jgi:hypothetical protein
MNDFLENLYTLWGTLADIGTYAANQQLYYDDIFPSVALCFFAAIAVPAIYYFLLTGQFSSSSWGTKGAWWAFFSITFLVVVGVTIWIAMDITQQVEVDIFMVYLGIWNAFLVALLYFGFSVLFKGFSVHAKNRPF